MITELSRDELVVLGSGLRAAYLTEASAARYSLHRRAAQRKDDPPETRRGTFFWRFVNCPYDCVLFGTLLLRAMPCLNFPFPF